MRTRERTWCGVLLVCGGLLSGASAGIAQVFPGRITGTVRDSQGSVLAGATVKLTLPSTGVERAVTTNENGEAALGSFGQIFFAKGFARQVSVAAGAKTGVRGRTRGFGPA
jgi:carboxypeptidase family protein